MNKLTVLMGHNNGTLEAHWLSMDTFNAGVFDQMKQLTTFNLIVF